MREHQHEIWVATGTPQNWRTAFNVEFEDTDSTCGMWGSPSNQVSEPDIYSKDYIICKATKPVSGVVGYGRIKRTKKGETPVFAEEETGQIKYPMRTIFEVKRTVDHPWTVNAESFSGIDGYRGSIVGVADYQVRRELLRKF